MNKETYIGIDSGSLGAIAAVVVTPEGTSVSIYDMPKDYESIVGLVKELRELGDRTVTIEKVHAIPGQSSSSMFAYGGNYKIAELIAQGLSEDFKEVSPNKWKSFYGLSRAKGETKSQFKRKSVDLIRAMLGHEDVFLVSKDGRAEAALIGLFPYFNNLAKENQMKQLVFESILKDSVNEVALKKPVKITTNKKPLQAAKDSKGKQRQKGE